MSSQTIDLTSQRAAKTVTTTKTSAGSRMLYIDNLRILLTVLVILHHLAIGYGGLGSWYYQEAGPMSDVGEILMVFFAGINQAFFMGFFFLISSYFTPGSVDRKGSWVYIKDRLIRLGIPLIFYIICLAPIIKYATSRSVIRFNASLFQSFWTSSINYIKSYPDIGIDVGPLWFVLTLLVFSIVYGLGRLVINPASTLSRGETQTPGNMAIALFALGVGLVTFTVRIWLPIGWEYWLLHLQFPFFPQYIAMLTVGILAYRRNWFAGITATMGKQWAVTAVAAVVVFTLIFQLGEGFDRNLLLMRGGLRWQSLALAIWEQVICVSVVISLIAWFRRRFNQQGVVTQGLSGAAYAAYIFHAPVIVLLAVSLRRARMDLGLKFLWVAPFAVALSFLVGYLFKQLPGARRIL